MLHDAQIETLEGDEVIDMDADTKKSDEKEGGVSPPTREAAPDIPRRLANIPVARLILHG